METVIMIDPDGNEVEVGKEDVGSARERGLEAAAEFDTPEGQRVTVRDRDFGAAFEKGLKPANHQDMSFWQAMKEGAKRGWDVFASSETGLEPEAPTLEREQAYAEHPVGYGLGVAAGLAPAIGAGAALVGGAAYGTKKAVQAAKPYVAPSAQAAKQTYLQSQQNEMIPNVAGATRPIVGGMAALKAAVKQVPETMREEADLAKLERVTTNQQAGSLGQSGKRFGLGQEVLEPGATPEKKAMAERAATIAGSNIRIKPLQEAMAMGTTRRQQARNFWPQEAAEEIAPKLKSSMKELGKAAGGVYEPLHQQAAKEYNPELGVGVMPKFNQMAEAAKADPRITDYASGVLDRAVKFLNRGANFNELPPEEQYTRLREARTFLRQEKDAMAGTKDPTIRNQKSMEALKEAHGTIDEVMKSIPAQAKADELYSSAKGARGAFFEAMEFGKGMKKNIDARSVQRLFGNNDKAYRIRDGINMMRQMLAKHGDEILPEKKAEMEAIVNRFDALQKQAEDKRLLEGLRQAQGPTSPAFDRTEALRTKKGLPREIFTSPANALNAADEFMASRVSKYFPGQTFEKLSQPRKNALIEMLMWRQENPDATMTDEESMFKKILKGK